MLRKVIAGGVTGLGISAVALVPSAIPEENSLQLLQQQISRLTEAIQRRMATDEERFRRIEEDIRQLKQRPDNTTTVQPITGQPRSVEPRSVEPRSVEPRSVQSRSVESRSVEPRSVQSRSVEPRSVEPRSVEPRSVEPRSVRPSSVQPNRHCHYDPRYVSCPPPWWEPWW
jgi:hypothetical protein